MSITSMTGFARGEGELDGYAWTWEAKSVNGKGLDVRCRLPLGYDELDIQARNLVAAKFKRGNVSLGLTLRRRDGAGAYRVNRELLDQLIQVAKEVDGAAGLGPPRLDSLFSVRGVVEAAEDAEDGDGREALKSALLESLEATLGHLVEMRGGEGRRLADTLEEMLEKVTELQKKIAGMAAVQPDMIRARLKEQVAELVADVSEIPEERLAQEAALLMTRTDIREEVDRLKSHIDAAAELLKSGGVVGRKLDFLCQEFNREANTICSKSADVELTNVGLELKAAVEQFREQVQNIE